MGVLMEKVNENFPSISDLSRGDELVRRFHQLELVHGDLNRYNFVVDHGESGGIRLIDFECAEDYKEAC